MMKFCAKCGNQLPESGVCDCAAPPVAPSPVPPPMHHAPVPPPPAHYAPPPASHYAPPPMHHEPPPHMHPGQHHVPRYPRPGSVQNPFEAAIDVFKQFFTKNPENAILAALNSVVNTWFVVLGVFALVTAISVTVIYGQLVAMIPFGMGAFLPDLRAAIFFATLIVTAIGYFIGAGLIMLVFVIYKINVPFIKVMDMYSATHIPIIISIAAALFLGLIHLPLAIIVVFTGLYGTIVMIYRGMQEIAGAGRSIFWGFIGMYGVQLLFMLMIT